MLRPWTVGRPVGKGWGGGGWGGGVKRCRSDCWNSPYFGEVWLHLRLREHSQLGMVGRVDSSIVSLSSNRLPFG